MFSCKRLNFDEGVDDALFIIDIDCWPFILGNIAGPDYIFQFSRVRSPIPLGSVFPGQITAHRSPAEAELPHKRPVHVVDAQGHVCISGRVIWKPGFWIEWIGKILI